VLIAVSGGADSVALFHQLRSLPYRLFVGHVDHALRSDSSKDARFVQRLAAQWDVPCQVAKVSVASFARQKKQTLEEAARTLRYRALGKLATRWKCRAVLTAHTADDQVETVLMNVLRGTGPRGLAGMPYKRPLHAGSRILLVRPLLDRRRASLRNYLKEHKLEWREDPTNQDPRFTRNYLRLSVLPLLETRFPGVGERLLHMAAIFNSERPAPN
jgi:tRNA(Ile)-lysidine synthase